MPLINVTISKDLLNQKEKDKLISQLSNAVLTAEQAPITDAGAQSLVWAHINEKPNNAIYVGGKNIEQAPIVVAVTTPQGALNGTRRSSLVKDIGKIIDDTIGVYPERLNHWVMMHEVAEGSWAGGGQIFPLEGIQAAMNIKAG